MDDALAFAHDRAAPVRDVQVVWQHQGTYHAALVLVVVDLLKGRTAVACVEQELIKVRGVLFHHRSDLVVHEVAYAVGLHKLLACFLAQYLRAHGAFGRQKFLQRGGLELDNALGQQRVAHAACAFEWLGALLHGEAQELDTLAVLVFPILA